MLSEQVAMTAGRWRIPLTCPPPPKFREAGQVAWAQIEQVGPFGLIRSRPSSRAAVAGIYYEQKVHCELARRFPRTGPAGYAVGPWISFRQEGSGLLRWSQPDGFILDWRRALVIVVECKIKHSTRAWWGLRSLYEPVCAALFGPQWHLALCEVVNYYDPTVQWPEAHRMVREPTDLKAGEIGVHIWRA